MVEATGDLGALLRSWRAARGWSQLDLALRADLSQRHLSFVESGRSRASRKAVLALAQALEVPLRESNALLLAAGYAPAYAQGAFEEAEMAGVNAAIERMLRQQEPYPALVLDRHWNVVRTNAIAPRLFGRFVDLEAIARPRNLLRLLFDPEGLRRHVADWETLAQAMLARLHREAVGRVLDPEAERLLHDLMASPEVKPEWRVLEPAIRLPVVPIGLIHEGEVIRYFSMVCTVGAPETLLTQELRLECMFPADAASEARHHALIGR